MRIAAWNVNSIRARIDHLTDWLRAANPDVLCLQETKVVDDDFPADSFSRLGYECTWTGEKTYNGVAILSRHALVDVTIGHADARPDDSSRLIAATVNGVRVLSAYVPNGKTLDSPSYIEKLEWLSRLRRTLDATCKPDQAIVLGGDFNIARDDRDVFEPEQMRGKIHFSEKEHQALNDVLSFGLSDSFRVFTDEAQLFSWWDYRMGAFRRNRGMRIDYLFVSKIVEQGLKNATIDTEPRRWSKPSDHAPVLIEFEL
jgi:exodeoxyribonuclease-3